jgi:hypothetical protein
MASTTTTAPAKAPTAKVKREIAAKRAEGLSLAELKRAYPGVDVRAVLEAAKVPAPTTTGEPNGYSGSGPTVGKREPKRVRGATNAAAAAATTDPEPVPAEPKLRSGKAGEKPAAKAPKAKAERKPIDPKLAARAVKMRGTLSESGKPTSWAKIAFALKLVPEGAPKAQAGDAARRAFRQVRGADAPTGPSDY